MTRTSTNILLLGCLIALLLGLVPGSSCTPPGTEVPGESSVPEAGPERTHEENPPTDLSPPEPGVPLCFPCQVMDCGGTQPCKRDLDCFSCPGADEWNGRWICKAGACVDTEPTREERPPADAGAPSDAGENGDKIPPCFPCQIKDCLGTKPCKRDRDCYSCPGYNEWGESGWSCVAGACVSSEPNPEPIDAGEPSDSIHRCLPCQTLDCLGPPLPCKADSDCFLCGSNCQEGVCVGSEPILEPTDAGEPSEPGRESLHEESPTTD